MNEEIKETIKYYNENADHYFNSTVNANMKSIYEEFLKYIQKGGYILDFGCGSGRDSKFFMEQGYRIRAIDGSSKLCELATSYIGQKAECMNFLDLNDQDLYDGIWASASLLHLPKEELIEVLKKISVALKNYGYLYAGFKNGNSYEIIEGRYFNYLTKKDFIELLSCNKELVLIDTFDNRSVSNPNETKYWNNFILQKRNV